MAIEINDGSLVTSLSSSDIHLLTNSGGTAFTRITHANLLSIIRALGFTLFNIKDYGAKVDGRTISGLNTTNGQNVVTSDSAAFSSADVGKVLEVFTLSGNVHAATIITYTSSTQVSLSSNVAFTTTAGICHVGTDDTEAWKDTLQACADAGGGFVFQPLGMSIVNGPIITNQDGLGSNPNCQIPIPLIDAVSDGGVPISIKIIGEAPPTSYNGGLFDMKAEYWNSCSILKSTLLIGSATRAAVFGSIAYPDAYGAFNPVDVHIENLWIRTSPNGAVGGANLYYCTGTQFKNVTVDRTLTGFNTWTPTFDTYGLMGGHTNGGTMYSFENTMVVGFKRAYFFGEHSTGDQIQAMCCESAFAFEGPANHASCFGSMGAFWCKNALEADAVNAGVHYINIDMLRIEYRPSAGKWYDSQYGVKDTSNHLKGKVTYHSVTSSIGPDEGNAAGSFVKSGGSNLTCTPIF